jgi:uncharacterized membrane protein
VNPPDDTENRNRSAYQALLTRLFVTAEGRIFVAGLGIALAGLIAMGAVAPWSPKVSSIIGAMAFTNIAFGRAVSMSIGYAAGYSHWLVIPVNMIVETVLVLLFYPLFVFSLNKLVVFPAIETLLERTRLAAIEHEGKVKRYGIAGLFVFVWFPFWMTGPVVGCAIGYLLGFSARLNLAVVLAGTYVAMVAWAIFLFDLQQRAADIGPWAPLLIIAGIIVVVVIGVLLNRRRRPNRNPPGQNQ